MRSGSARTQQSWTDSRDRIGYGTVPGLHREHPDDLAKLLRLPAQLADGLRQIRVAGAVQLLRGLRKRDALGSPLVQLTAHALHRPDDQFGRLRLFVGGGADLVGDLP